MYRQLLVSSVIMLAGCGASLSSQSNSKPLENSSPKLKIRSVGICSDDEASFGLVAPSCKTTKSISHLLESGSVAFGTLTAYCAVAPEPTVSKFTMAALAVGSGATQLLKFVVDNIPCEDTKEALSPEQRLEVETMICNQAGGKLVAGECFKPE
jgi:hypothetical protein